MKYFPQTKNWVQNIVVNFFLSQAFDEKTCKNKEFVTKEILYYILIFA
jgi:hypothetical protein